jgi:hypothetical protein
MSKELEALERLAMPDELHISECKKLGISPTQDYKIIKQSLQRLEAIDNANPSEANIDTATEMLLTELEMLSDCAVAIEEEPSSNWIEYAETVAELDLKLHFAYLDIKQALLKAQEQEKENELLKEIIKSFFDRGCPLHQYTDKEGILTIEVDNECSIMHLGEFKGVDLDKKLKEVLK